MKKKNKFKMLQDIILMSLVIIAAMIGLMTILEFAICNFKSFVAFVISVAFLVIFGRVNAW